MQILNIAGYKFTQLDALNDLKERFTHLCESLMIKGTILLSKEGININLSSEIKNILSFKEYLKTQPTFSDISFRESYSAQNAFKRLKVKIKKEIITLRQPDIHPEKNKAPSISPEEFKQWLDENRDITILDTRNDYEIEFGTFANAINLKISDFSEFPSATEDLPSTKPIVMFCTGGIRCEKAGLHLLKKGNHEVYQLDGGILNYFAKVGGTHYNGDCFVFDERIALDNHLQPTSTEQCRVCSQPIPLVKQTCLSCSAHLK